MEDQFSQLVSKVLAGEASDNEKNSLKQMLLESSEHTLMYNQIKEYWDADVNLTNKSDNVSFEENLLSRLNLDSEVKISKFRKLYVRITSAAAILFFVATCSLAYLYTASPRHLYTYSAQTVPTEYRLEDGTKVILNKNSSITFSSDYGEKRRDVQLKGEGFFKVTKDKTRPFSVEALGTKTEVLGTSFNVKSIQKTGNVITTLVTGSVRFIANNNVITLKPGEEINYSTESKKFEKKRTDTQYNTVWVSGRFNYTNVKFADLVDKLEYIYRLKIEIKDQKIANRIVSASFLNNESIENILNALKDELGFSYITKNSTQINIVNKNLNNKMPI